MEFIREGAGERCSGGLCSIAKNSLSDVKRFLSLTLVASAGAQTLTPTVYTALARSCSSASPGASQITPEESLDLVKAIAADGVLDQAEINFLKGLLEHTAVSASSGGQPDLTLSPEDSKQLESKHLPLARSSAGVHIAVHLNGMVYKLPQFIPLPQSGIHFDHFDSQPGDAWDEVRQRFEQLSWLRPQALEGQGKGARLTLEGVGFEVCEVKQAANYLAFVLQADRPPGKLYLTLIK